MDRRLLLDIPDLPPEAFKHVGDKRIKPEGGGGGKGGGGSSTQTVTQSIPKELVPYVKRAIERGEVVSNLQYVPYAGQRIAGFTPEQKATQAEVMGLRTPEQFKTAMQGTQGVGGLGFSSARQGLGRALQYAPGTFGRQEAAYYADPYQQAVTDIALREARKQGAMTARDLDLAAAGRGTYGGARNALMQSELQRNLGQQLSDIQAKGSEAGFLNAQAQYERDRAAAAQAAGLGAQVGTSGLGTSLQAGLGLGELANQYQAANLQRLQAQQTIGQQIQEQNQKVLAQRYQDFLEQRGYPKEQAAYYSDMVRGTAPMFGSVTQTRQPAPSLTSQLGGLGLAGLSLYNLVK